MSKTDVSRRTLAKGAAWSVPVVAFAAAAPAQAASQAPVACVPGFCKLPGAKRAWSYVVTPNCSGGAIKLVTIDGKLANRQVDGSWTASFTNSRAWRYVTITLESGEVLNYKDQFKPCHL